MRWTDAQIEAAVHAIRETFGNRSGFGAKWYSLPERIRQQYRDEARAALTAAAEAGWLPAGGDEDEYAANISPDIPGARDA
jgi:hypothetical protein